MDTRAIYVRLVELRNYCGSKLHERLKLADELLSNQLWVRSPSGGGGSELKAMDRLEADCFADLCGALSLADMLEILHAFPDLAVWEKNKFNLKKMSRELKEKHREADEKRGRKKRQKATPFTPHEGGEVDRVSPRVKTQDEENELAKARTEITFWKARAKELERENFRLKRALRKAMTGMSGVRGLVEVV